MTDVSEPRPIRWSAIAEFEVLRIYLIARLEPYLEHGQRGGFRGAGSRKSGTYTMEAMADIMNQLAWDTGNVRLKGGELKTAIAPATLSSMKNPEQAGLGRSIAVVIDALAKLKEGPGFGLVEAIEKSREWRDSDDGRLEIARTKGVAWYVLQHRRAVQLDPMTEGLRAAVKEGMRREDIELALDVIVGEMAAPSSSPSPVFSVPLLPARTETPPDGAPDHLSPQAAKRLANPVPTPGMRASKTKTKR